MINALIFLIIFSNDLRSQMRSNLYQKPIKEVPISAPRDIKDNVKDTKLNLANKKNSKNQFHQIKKSVNLPEYYQKNSVIKIDESVVVIPTKPQGVLHNHFKSGDMIQAQILESVIAFNEAKAPIRALIQEGVLKGIILMGEATLEKNSKRILIDFSKLRNPSGQQLYEVKATALDSKGILGLEGKLISGEDKYFTAEFLAAMAAGYADATITRDQTAFGNVVERPNVDTFSKRALATAMTRTADRFADKMKSAPEYSVLEGPVTIQILVTEPARLIQ